jgi:hypothetical protein
MAAPGAAGSQLGIKKETTYGTPVAVDRFYDAASEGMKVETQPITYRSFRSPVQQGSLRTQVVRGAGGPFQVPVTRKGMGILLQQVFGSSASAQVGGTAEYTQTHTLDETNWGKGMHATIQVGRSQTGGTVTPFTYDGCKVIKATFTCETDGFLLLDVTWACRYGVHEGASALALQTASYIADNPPFAWHEATVTINSVERILKSWSLDIDKTKDLERYGLGSVTRREPLTSGAWALTGNIDVEFENITDYETFIDGSQIPLNVNFATLVDEIETGVPFEIDFDMPAIVYDGDTPVIGGEGLIRQPLPYMVVDNGTDAPITVVQSTSDTAL